MNYCISLLALIALTLCAAAVAQELASDAAVDFIGIQSDRAVFQITNRSKDSFDYVRYEPTKSFENASIQTYKDGKWEDSGPFKCGTMTDEESARYVTHSLKPEEQLLTSISLQGVSHQKGDIIRIQVYLVRGNEFLKFFSNSREIK